MSAIVICEKPSQAADVRRAVGEVYGRVVACEGHLLRLAEPAEVNPAWKHWGYDLLKPDRFYPWRPNAGGGKRRRLAEIEAALKTASEVTIATDCDREGQLIGESLLHHFGYRGPVWRALFTAQDAKTLRAAFEARRPNSEYAHLFAAAMARQQADQVYNLTLTRAATTALRGRGEGGLIGIGRVKTATLAIACRREIEILDFTPKPYFEVVATASAAAARFTMRHAPGEDERILERAAAERIAAAAEGFSGPLAVERHQRRRRPPRLLDLPALQKRCGSWGWSADKTLTEAQALYERHKLITYPRAEAVWLTESQTGDIAALLAALGGVAAYALLVPDTPVIRKGKNGHFCDPCLAGVSHHAVVPNVNGLDQLAAALAKIAPDAARLFDLIARSYIAALLPDYEFEATKVTLDVAGHLFAARGQVPLAEGWRAAWSEAEDDKDDSDDDRLPPVADGEPARLDQATVEDKETRPPPRFHEGGLIEAMQAAWKFVDDEALAERLKDAKGIGTPATRATIIEGLKAQDMLVQRGKHIVPTEAGLALYRLLAVTAPALVDPGTTARWELRLDDILSGAAGAEEVWDEICRAAAEHVESLRAAGAEAGGSRLPTARMIAAARAIAARKAVTLPDAAAASFAVCKAFLDAHSGAKAPAGAPGAPGTPSAKQIAFAKKLARAADVALPKDVRADRAAIAAFIDRHKKTQRARRRGGR